MATTATSVTAEPRGQRNWDKAERNGYQDHRRGYGYRGYGGYRGYVGPYAYYGPYYYDPYYYPYYYQPYYGPSVSFSFGF